MRPVNSSGLRFERKGVLIRAQEAVVAGDLLGEGRNEAFAIDGDAELGLDAVEDEGDVEGSARLLEYVISHIDL
jgi:hypothetical protein